MLPSRAVSQHDRGLTAPELMVRYKDDPKIPRLAPLR